MCRELRFLELCPTLLGHKIMKALNKSSSNYVESTSVIQQYSVNQVSTLSTGLTDLKPVVIKTCDFVVVVGPSNSLFQNPSNPSLR